jgi:cytochrome P450
MAMSSSLFGPPSDDVDKAERTMGRAGGERVSAVVDRAIVDAKAAGAPGDTVLARLIRLQAEQRALQHERALTDVDIRSYLIGMITGFVPTNTIAAGNLLVMLLRRPDFMARAQAAVDAGDDDLLKRCLFEAMRFQPLNPGPFRVCTQDYRIAAGTPNEQLIKAGRKVLAGTQYAMFDETRVERPHEFDPDRPSFPYMMFGYGLHWCIGACLAEAQITQTFKALLERGPLEADVRKARYFGLFPGHLTVKYE